MAARRMLVAAIALFAATDMATADDKKGQDAYMTYCTGCHQFDGAGIPGVYPPLAGSAVVIGDARQLARLLLDGGFANSTMPKFRDVLDDATAAALLTYIRASWNNQATPVTTEHVSQRAAQ